MYWSKGKREGLRNWWSSDLWFVNCPRLPLTSWAHRRLQVHRKLMIVWGKWGKPSSHHKRLVFWKLKKKETCAESFVFFGLDCCRVSFPVLVRPDAAGWDKTWTCFLTLVCSARCLYHFRIEIWFASWTQVSWDNQPGGLKRPLLTWELVASWVSSPSPPWPRIKMIW